jgi:hypothetical protein
MAAFIDPRVAAVAALFVIASVGLAVLTVWFWRNSRLESPVLAPLEVMSERRFRKATEERRAELLAYVRPLAEQRPTEIDSTDLIAGVEFEPEPPPTVIDPLLGRRGN